VLHYGDYAGGKGLLDVMVIKIEYKNGLKIQRMQELGLKIPVASRNFYAYDRYIRVDGG